MESGDSRFTEDRPEDSPRRQDGAAGCRRVGFSGAWSGDCHTEKRCVGRSDGLRAALAGALAVAPSVLPPDEGGGTAFRQASQAEEDAHREPEDRVVERLDDTPEMHELAARGRRTLVVGHIPGVYPSRVKEYNPLDYANLTRNCVEQLMMQGPFDLPLDDSFIGAGVYALFYRGDAKIYSKVRSPEGVCPIYVGKAVPPGGRKGGVSPENARPLFGRLTEHTNSIDAASNLRIADFFCRYLVVTPLWITMAERFLLEHYKPVWNVCIEGFGNHDPGKGRHAGEITWWDALHPGRQWAEKLRANRTKQDAEDRLSAFLRTYETPDRRTLLAHLSSDDDLASRASSALEEEDE